MEFQKERIQWGTHIEFAVLFITLIGGFYTIDSKFERCHERTDKLYEQFQEAAHFQSKRTDKLYEMFYEVVKEGRK